VASVLPIVLLALAGLFVGGIISLRQQGAGMVPIVGLAVLAVLAAAGGILWLWG
jgi:hypothetical protein